MKKIGFIGLGNMGKSMARNLLKGGYEVTVFDIRAEAIEELKKEGAKGASSLSEVGSDADTVFVMVLNVKQVEAVTLGENGAISGMKPGSTLIVTSTIAPSEIQKIADIASEKGIDTIDSPVSGGTGRAADGSLVMMVSCEDSVYEKCKDALLTVGSNTIRVGKKIGMGQTVKAANQLLVSIHVVATAEAMVLATKAGVDPELLFEVIKKSVGTSFMFEQKVPLILARDFRNRGALDIQIKDLDICLKMGRELDVPLYLSALSRELFIMAEGKGYGREDLCAVTKLLEEVAHVEVKKQ